MTISRGNSRNRHEIAFLIGIGILAIAVRGAVAVLTTSWMFPTEQNSWSFGYEVGQIAASIATGGGFSWPVWSSYPQGPTAWMPPVYPIFIAAIFKLLGVYSDGAAIAILVIQTITSLLTCFFFYAIGKRLFNAQVGLLVAFWFAVYPPSIHFAVQKIWPTSLFVCCLSMLILQMLQLTSTANVKIGLRVGLLAGFTALVDPIVVVTYPFAALWFYFNSKAARMIVWRVVGVALAGFFLTIAPWLLRNYIVFGRYVFIKSNFGNELFLGNNPKASGSFKAPEAAETLTLAEREFLEQADEASRNALLFQKAITFISMDPLQFLRRTMSRFVQFWTFMMQPAGGASKTISLLSYFTLLILGIAGLLLSGLRRSDVQLLALFIMALPLPYYFTVVGLFRYRFPVEALLVIPAAYTVYRGVVAVSARRASFRNSQETAERHAATEAH